MPFIYVLSTNDYDRVLRRLVSEIASDWKKYKFKKSKPKALIVLSYILLA